MCSKNSDFVLLRASQRKRGFGFDWVDIRIETGIIPSDTKANTIITNETGPMKLQMK